MQSSHGNPLIFKDQKSDSHAWWHGPFFSDLSVAQVYAMLEDMEVQSIIADADTDDFFWLWIV